MLYFCTVKESCIIQHSSDCNLINRMQVFHIILLNKQLAVHDVSVSNTSTKRTQVYVTVIGECEAKPESSKVFSCLVPIDFHANRVHKCPL